MAVQAGAVWIPVLPDMSKFKTTLRAGMSVSSVSGAGAEAGKSFSTSMLRAVRTGISPLSGEVAAQARAAADAAAAAVAAESKKVTAARAKEETAAGRVRVAELKLQEVRAKESASASQIAAAEERLAAAERGHVAAADAAAAADSRLGAAQQRAAATATTMSTESVVAGGRFRAMSGTVGAGATAMSSKLGGFAKAVGGMAGIFAGFEVAKFAGESVKAASEYQKTTSVLVTAAGESVKNLALIRKGLVEISDNTGTTTDQLTEGMYTIEKAGIRGANGLKVLDAAAKGAKEENADLGTVTNAMTSIMNSYGIKAGQSVQVMNALKTAAAQSKTSMQNFAGSLSTVLPIAAANKISFADVAGAIGTLTSHGTSAQEATQELAFSIRSLSAPNAVAVKEMGQFGIKSQDVATQLGKKGLQGTINELSQAVLTKMGPSGKVLLNTFYQSTSAAKSASQMFDKLPAGAKKVAQSLKDGSVGYKDWLKSAKELSPVQYNQVKQWAALQVKSKGFNDAIKQGLPGSQTYSEAMKKMMGGATGLNTALMLTGTSAEATKKRTDAVAKSYADNAKEVEGWEATQKTAAVAQDRMKNSIKNAGMVMATAFLPALTKMTTAMADGITDLMKWGSQNWSWLGPTAKILGVMGGALLAFSIVGSITRWIKGWAIVQALLNTEMGTFDALMDANPVGVIVVGVAALTAGLVLAYQKIGPFRTAVDAVWSGLKTGFSWVESHWKLVATILVAPFAPFIAAVVLAYTKFDWFHNGVNAMFSAIKNAASAAFGWLVHDSIPAVKAALDAVVKVAKSVASGFKTAFDAVKKAVTVSFAAVSSAVTAVGKTFRSIWQGWIYPVVDLFGAMVKALWNVTVKPVFGWIKTGWRDLGTGIKATYNNVVKPTISALESAWSYLWNHSAKPVFGWIKDGWQALGTAGRTTYNATIKPTISALESAWSFLWNHSAKPIFGYIKTGWHGLGTGLRATYDATIKPTISALKTAVGSLKTAFKTAVDAIRSHWDDIKSIAKAPVKFVIDTVINKGLIGTFNWLAGKFGTAKMKPISIPGFDTGGYTGAGGKYEPAGIVHRGEMVFEQQAVAKHGIGPLNALRSGAARIVPGYSDGGIVGDIWNGAKGLLGKLNPLNYINDAINKLLGGVGSSPYAKLLIGGVKKGLEGLGSWIAGKFSFGGGGDGGGNLSTTVKNLSGIAAAALSDEGAPASLLSLLLHRIQVESGGNPSIVNKWDSNWQRGTPSVGLMQVIGPTYQAYKDPRYDVGPYLYGTSVDPTANVTAAIRYTRAAYGGNWEAAWGGTHGYADGGRPPVGVASVVGERGPELFIPDRPGRILSNSDSRQALSAGGNIHIDTLTIHADAADLESLGAFMKMLQVKTRMATGVSR